MANSLNQSLYVEDEIDLKEIFKILIESKKLIISTILIFTIASIFYSLSLKPSFKSSTILEMGYYEMPDGTQKLIEQPSDLISNLKIYQLLNNQQYSSFKTIEKKLIRIETYSNNATDNEKILSSMITFINNRHNELSIISSNLRKNTLEDKIDLIDSEISFIRAKELSKIEDRLARLKNELPIIDIEISQLEKIILDDSKNLSLLKENENMLKERAAISPTLEQIIFNYKTQINALNRDKSSYILEIESLNNQLKNFENETFQSDQLFSLEQEKAILKKEMQMLMTQTQAKTLPIGNIETNTIKPKTQLTILLGIIIGFITGILLVFIRILIKSFREREA